METKDFLAYEIEGVGKQLKAVFEGVPEAVQDQKVSAGSMTPREMAEHLAEAYHAVILDRQGKKHEWGSYSVDDTSWANLLKTLWEKREAAKKAVCVNDDESVKAGFDYIVAHDAYHVGQLASLRIQTDPDWDPYSIYE